MFSGFLPQGLPDFSEPSTIFGALALMCSCVWPLLHGRKVILSVQACGSTLFALHYFLLGATTAAFMCLMGVMQGIAVVTLASRNMRIGVVAGTVGLSFMATSMTWSGTPSLFAQFGQFFGAMGRLQMDTQRLRLLFLVSTLCWISHNVMVGSVFGLAADTLALSGLLVGLWRNRSRSDESMAPSHPQPKAA